jgi:hypothetical protein
MNNLEESSSAHQESPIRRGGLVNKLALNQGVANSTNLTNDLNKGFY